MPKEPDTAKTLRRPDGATIAYRCSSTSAVPTGMIVLIHGMASNLTRWSEFVRNTTLRRNWAIVRLDLRGHGASPVRRRLSMARWCDDIAAILDAECHPRAVLVGHCLGANIALQFASRFPQKTQGLVLIEPILPDAQSTTLRIARTLRPLILAMATGVRILNRIGIRRRRIPALDLAELDRITRLTMAQDHDSESLTRRYASPWQDLRYTPSANYLDDLAAVTGPLPPFARLQDVPALALLSTGAAFSRLERTRALLAKMHGCRVVTLESRHWIPTEAPDAMRQAIDRWCADLPAPR